MGMALGPLVGGTLGTISLAGTASGDRVARGRWRQPRSRSSVKAPLPKPDDVPISVGLTAPRHRPLPDRGRSGSATARDFTVIVRLLAYAPHALAGAAEASGAEHSSPTHLGPVFFGWGSALAIFSPCAAQAPLNRYLGWCPPSLVGVALIGEWACCVSALNASESGSGRGSLGSCDGRLAGCQRMPLSHRGRDECDPVTAAHIARRRIFSSLQISRRRRDSSSAGAIGAADRTLWGAAGAVLGQPPLRCVTRRLRRRWQATGCCSRPPSASAWSGCCSRTAGAAPAHTRSPGG